MKIATVIGARPQFIKAAAVSGKLREKHQEVLIHTGQHYDDNMSESFFTEMQIPHPNFNLGVGSASHAVQTANIMIGLEDIFQSEKPDAVLIYGDTNSTLAGALVAGKLCIPIAHVEAGGRTGVMDMPEEQNRIIADHLATWNFCSSDDSVQKLAREGLTQGVYDVGDVMYDTLLHFGAVSEKLGHQEHVRRLRPLSEGAFDDDQWYLATVHRPENTDDEHLLIEVLDALNFLDKRVLFPAHPRIRSSLQRNNAYKKYRNIYFTEPLSYLSMLHFSRHATKIVTDSGGLHKEAYLWKVPAVVILRGKGWVETFEGNWNVLASPNKEDILNKFYHTDIDYDCYSYPYGDGTAGEKIVEILSR